MKMRTLLEIALQLCAFGQLCIALLNLNLVRMMGWREEVAGMSLLVREVFHVHAWFVSITLGIFAALTWRFAGEIAAGAAPIFRWVAMSIAFFWAVRTVLQVVYYSSSHWRGIASKTAVHFILLLIYGSWAILYGFAALQK